MSDLPKQVQAQLEEAERIQQQLAQPPTPVAEDPAPVVADPPADPPADPQPQPAPVEPAEPQDAAYWQQRFKTMEGIHRQAVEHNKALATQVQQISTRLETLTQPQAPTPQPETPLVTNQDDEKFGSDLVDLARRAAREELRAVGKRLQTIEDLIKRVTPQVERVRQVEDQVVQSRVERFWSELSTAVSDWEQINANPNWLKWLSEYDPVAGCTRQESLAAAQAALDHRRVIGLFKLFKGPTPAARPTPSPELARQVAPSRTSTVTVQPQAARRFTGQDYQFWLDPRRANDRDATEVKTMRAELDRAHAEGRIDW